MKHLRFNSVALRIVHLGGSPPSDSKLLHAATYFNKNLASSGKIPILNDSSVLLQLHPARLFSPKLPTSCLLLQDWSKHGGVIVTAQSWPDAMMRSEQHWLGRVPTIEPHPSPPHTSPHSSGQHTSVSWSCTPVSPLSHVESLDATAVATKQGDRQGQVFLSIQYTGYST